MQEQHAETVAPAWLQAQGWKARELPGHMGQIGPLWTRRLADGAWAYGLLAGAQHLNPAGVVHGGALLSLADHALSTAAWEACGRVPCVTVQLDAHFVAPVRTGQFVQLQPQLVQRSASLLFMRAELAVQPPQQPLLVLTAQAIMKMVPPR